ncbi:MAG: MFS transporter [Chloroflexi bacterium]|nr:MFS transporter [Chloroflexota bacterium]MCY3697156.1 MFS transporter [Chloroflexota bacterium]
MAHAAPTTPTAATVGFALPHRTKMVILGSAVVVMFLSAVQHSIVATATPVLAADLGRIDLIAFMESAFMATSVPAVAIAGRMSDVYGRKPFLLGGLVIFAGATALAGFATSMEMLIGFRALQGIGGGVLMGNTFAISGDLFPPAERAKYMGIFAAVFGVGGLVGPLLGGLIVDALNWRWVFWSILPLAALAFASIAFIMPWLRPPPRKVVIDWLGIGAMLLALMPAMLALGLVSTGTPWLDIKTLVLFGVSALGVLAFIGAERSAREPILPGTLFRNHTFRVAALVMAVIGGGLFGVSFFLAYFMQGVLGYSPTESGLLLSTQIISLVIAATVGGQVVSRTGRYKAMSIVATVIIVISGWLMTQLSTETDAVDVIWRLVLFGAGLGILYPALMTAAQNALPQSMLGTVSGATQFFEEMGAIIGVTLVGALVTGRLTSELAARLPSDLAAHADPTQLLSEEASSGLLAQIGEAGFLQVLEALPEALAIAITSNFWLSAGVGVVAFFAVITLREKRLRTGEHDLPEVPEGALGPPRHDDSPVSVGASNGANGNGRFGGGWANDPAPVARVRPQRSTIGGNGSH